MEVKNLFKPPGGKRGGGGGVGEPRILERKINFSDPSGAFGGRWGGGGLAGSSTVQSHKNGSVLLSIRYSYHKILFHYYYYFLKFLFGLRPHSERRKMFAVFRL